MPRRFQTPLYKHRAYGVGSLTVQTRTIVQFLNLGRTVVYVAGPVPVGGKQKAGFKIPGKQYSCSRKLFVCWLRTVLPET